MAIRQEQEKFALHLANLIEWIFKNNCTVTLGEAWRTNEQAMIYAKQGKGIINSLHCQRLAVDLNIFDASGKLFQTVEEYRKAGEYWQSLDKQNRWGGIFRERADANHFERQLPK